MQGKTYKTFAILLGLLSIYTLISLAIMFGGGLLFPGQTVDNQSMIGNMVLLFVIPVWSLGSLFDNSGVILSITSLALLFLSFHLYKKSSLLSTK